MIFYLSLVCRIFFSFLGTLFKFLIEVKEDLGNCGISFLGRVDASYEVVFFRGYAYFQVFGLPRYDLSLIFNGIGFTPGLIFVAKYFSINSLATAPY